MMNTTPFNLSNFHSFRHYVIPENMDEKPLGSNNPTFHSPIAAATTHLHSMIFRRVMSADSTPSLSHDEVHSFNDEGLDSDVDDLSQLDSEDEGD